MNINHILSRMMTTIAFALTTIAAMADEMPAFPGAEGFGMYTTGGRKGIVYHVTNLNDDGEGSLRWAVGQSGRRIIVFDVSGTIHLKSELRLKNANVTIAGQTAPGDGICVADYPFVIAAKNVIIRYMRFRLGNEALKKNPNAHEGDGLGGMDSENIIIDHCSVSWSIDECLSVYGSKNLTVQWCIASQSLCNAGHSKGAHGYGGNWGGSGASYHHNLIAHHVSRTPRLGPRPGTQTDERMDMRNNVIYNWIDNGVYGAEGMNVNIVNNYYKPTSATKSGAKGMRIAAPGIRTTEYTKHGTSSANQWDVMWHVWGKYYVAGNVNTMYTEVTRDNWTYGIYNQIGDNDGTYTQTTKDTIRLSQPIAFVNTTTHTADMAFERVLNFAGASLHRDAVDELIVSDTRNGNATYTGSGNAKGIINSQDDLKPADAPADWSAWPELKQGEVPVDTDQDGMPDAWETAHGLNPNDKNDGKAIADNGYTNVENYINSLVDDITVAQNEGGIMLSGQQDFSNSINHPTLLPKVTDKIYALDGRSVNSAMRKGIYIVNNRKIVVK